MPKRINPATHVFLDYAVAASFLIMGVVFWKRSKRAAIGSLLCGGATAANIMFTDYPGSGSRNPISFKVHGHIDTGISGMAAAMPRLLRFEDEREAKFFEIGALSNTAIVALTDFDQGQSASSNRSRTRAYDDAPEDTVAQ